MLRETCHLPVSIIPFRCPSTRSRQPSQRASAEVHVRREVDRVEAERREEQRSGELVGAQNTYMYWKLCATQAEKELKERGRYTRPKSKTQSTSDRYAGEVAKVLEDYDADDTAALLMLALLKLQISGRPALSIGCSF